MELGEIIKDCANRNGVNPELVASIAYHESVKATNPIDVMLAQFATRHEVGFFKKYILKLSHSLTTTEAQERATSWGYMQIMGQVARELGFSGKFLAQLLDPRINFEYGSRKLAQCMQKAKGNTSKALLYYNGGGDISYPDKVLKVLKSREFEVLLNHK